MEYELQQLFYQYNFPYPNFLPPLNTTNGLIIAKTCQQSNPSSSTGFVFDGAEGSLNPSIDYIFICMQHEIRTSLHILSLNTPKCHPNSSRARTTIDDNRLLYNLGGICTIRKLNSRQLIQNLVLSNLVYFFRPCTGHKRHTSKFLLNKTFGFKLVQPLLKDFYLFIYIMQLISFFFCQALTALPNIPCQSITFILRFCYIYVTMYLFLRDNQSKEA